MKRRKKLWIAGAALGVAVFAAYFVLKQPTVDARIQNGVKRIAKSHRMVLAPERSEFGSGSEDGYVRVDEVYVVKGASHDEWRAVLSECNELCEGWNVVSPWEHNGWEQDWGVRGQQSVAVKWNPENGELSIEFFCQKRSYGYLMRGLLPDGYQRE